MISTEKHAVRLFFALILSFVLWGCGGGTPKILNGEPITGLAGSVDSVKTYRVTIPDNTTALMLVLSGNADVQAELLLVGETTAGIVCQAPDPCVLSAPVAGEYELKLTAINDYADVSIALSWGGPDDSVMSNGMPLTGLNAPAGSVRLTSLYLDEYQPSVLLEVSNIGIANLVVYDAQGYVLPSCGASCDLQNMAPGLYFVSIFSNEPYADGVLSIRWGDAISASLQNGVPLRGISAAPGDIIVETLYIPEQAGNVMIISDSVNAYATLMNNKGEVVEVCDSRFEYRWRCITPGLEPGLYNVRLEFLDAVTGMSLTVAWGGDEQTSLQNNVQLLREDALFNDILLDSIYVPDDAEFVALRPLSNAVYQIVFDQAGEQRFICFYESPCIISSLDTGQYFVATLVVEPLQNDRLYLTYNYAGAAYSTLKSGELKLGVAKPESGTAVETMSGGALTAGGAFTSGWLYQRSLYGIQGQVENCREFYVCTMEFGADAAYIAYADWVEGYDEPTSFSFSTWTEEVGSLQHREVKSGLAESNETIIAQTFVVPEGVSGFMVAGRNPYLENNVYLSVHRADDLSSYVYCDSDNACFWGNPEPGPYIVQAWSDEPETAEFTVSLTFGGEAYASIGSGGLNHYSDLVSGDWVMESIYVPDNATGLMMSTSESAYFELFSANGKVKACDEMIPCAIAVESGEVYFARVQFSPYPESLTIMDTALAFTGTGNFSLQNGSQRNNRLLYERGPVVESFDVPAGTEALAFSTYLDQYGEDLPVSLTLFSFASGQAVEVCSGQRRCALKNPLPGPYFAHIYNYKDYTQDTYTLSYSLLLANKFDTTIKGNTSFYDGDVKSGNLYLDSFYLPEAESTFSLAGIASLYDSSGNEVPMYSGVGDEGIYFIETVSLYFGNVIPSGYSIAFGDVDNVSIPVGEQVTFVAPPNGGIDIQTVYVPEDVGSLILQPTPYAEFTSISFSGSVADSLDYCVAGKECLLVDPLPGVYFVSTIFPSESAGTIEEYSIMVELIE